MDETRDFFDQPVEPGDWVLYGAKYGTAACIKIGNIARIYLKRVHKETREYLDVIDMEYSKWTGKCWLLPRVTTIRASERLVKIRPEDVPQVCKDAVERRRKTVETLKAKGIYHGDM